MKHLLTTILLLCFCYYSSFSQVSGVVLDQNNNPLEFANVLLLNASDSTLIKGDITLDQGVYTFTDIENGQYFVEANMIGYDKAYSEIFTYKGAPITINSISVNEGIQMEEVTVVGRKPLIELKADKVVVNVANSIVDAGNSALEVLKKSPGVTVDHNDNISLRGREGVMVMINGKQQYMSGDEIARLLSTMSANTIQSIEIITNPSAKYDAEGNVGIINIVMKKNENLGYNGSVSITDRQGRRNSAFAKANLNYRNEHINIYGGGDGYIWGRENVLSLDRNVPGNNGFTNFSQESQMRFGGDGFNANLGVDWMVSPKTTLGFLVKTNQGDEDNDNINNTFIEGVNAPNYFHLFVDTDGIENYSQSTANVNLRHDFNQEGLTLTFDTDYTLYSNDAVMDYRNNYYDVNGSSTNPEYLLRNNTNKDIMIFASKIDLTVPVSEKLKLEVGSKISSVETENATLFKDKQGSEGWMDISTRSNTFMYTEQVLAGYVNANTQMGPFMVQAGFRVEHTDSEGFSVTLDQKVPRSYTDYFPSLSLSHQLGEKHSLSYTYSRRLDRPGYKSLNPFEYYLDEYTFERGNPFLNPQYSHNFGLNYSLGNALFVSANYSHTTDAISEIIEQNEEENTTFKTEMNLDDFRSYSLNVMAPKVWTEWFTSRLSYTSFLNEFNSTFSEGDIDKGRLSHVIFLGNEFSLPNGLNLELSGNYQSKLVYGIFELDPRWQMNFGISKRVMNGKGSIKFNISDIFLTDNSKVDIQQGDIDLVVDQVNDTRRASLSFNYNFGNQKVKRARRRQTATEEEKGRI